MLQAVSLSDKLLQAWAEEGEQLAWQGSTDRQAEVVRSNQYTERCLQSSAGLSIACVMFCT